MENRTEGRSKESRESRVKRYYRLGRAYLRRVRIIEREIGGELHAC